MTWTEDKNDKELSKLIPILEKLSKIKDVRDFIPSFVKFNKVLFELAYSILDINLNHNTNEITNNKKYQFKTPSTSISPRRTENIKQHGITEKNYSTYHSPLSPPKDLNNSSSEKTLKILNDKIDEEIKKLSIGVQKKMTLENNSLEKDPQKNKEKNSIHIYEPNTEKNKPIAYSNPKGNCAIKCFQKFASKIEKNEDSLLKNYLQNINENNIDFYSKLQDNLILKNNSFSPMFTEKNKSVVDRPTTQQNNNSKIS